MVKEKGKITFYSPSLTVTLDSQSGAIERLDAGFGNLLRAPMTYNFSRADLDNDCGIELFVSAMKFVNPIRSWEKAQEKLRVQSIKTKVTESQATITLVYKMPHLRHFKTIITISSQGTMRIEASLTPLKDLIRFGMTLGLDPSYAWVSFYGKGPQENYCDRKHGSKLGLHQGILENFNHNYMRPQENGNHTEVRFLELSDDKNKLRFEAMSPCLLETSVWPYTQDQLKAAKHNHELPSWTMTTVNLDYGQKGVAGDLPGFYMGPDHYKLKANRSYVYGFSLKINSLK
jgi:beta-galactosidase